MYCNVCKKYRKFKKKTKTSYMKKKHQEFLLFTVIVVMNIKKYINKKDQLKY